MLFGLRRSDFSRQAPTIISMFTAEISDNQFGKSFYFYLTLVDYMLTCKKNEMNCVYVWIYFNEMPLSSC